MRRIVLKSRWSGRGVLVTLALAAAILGLLLLGSGVRAEGPQFNATASTEVSGDTNCKANADILSTFSVEDDPWPAAQYEAQISFTPSEWGVPESADIPIGAVVGKLVADATLGWFNSPCAAAYGGSLHINFDPMMNCSIDTSDTVTFDEQFDSADGNMIQDGCDHYPEFLTEMFPGMTPRTRHAAFEFIGINVSLNFMTFEPGTSIPATAAPGVPTFGANLGYVAMSVLNNPKAPLVPNQITDNCPPLSTETTYYGLTQDNTLTAEDESGVAWRTNPESAGTYTFNGYSHSIRDADGDDIDNEMDTCVHVVDTGDPRVMGSGDTDSDGLPDVCDPTPSTSKTDFDNDTFPNRQDNCPLVSNVDQADGDLDGIGDVCDQDDWNNDGDTTDPGEPTGFSNGVANGDNTLVWFATDVEISGDACEEEGAEGSPTPTATATATATGTVVAAVETTLAEDASAGDTEIVVEDATGFAEGDTIKIGTGDTAEECTITAVADTTLTLDCTLEFDHAAGEAVVKVQAVVLTPTPTATAEVEICAPVFPGTYNGLVRINGQPAASGYEVTASIGDLQWGSAIVSGGRYAMDIPDYLPSEAPCFEGGSITFALDGMTCTPTADWASGIQTVDLSCAPVAPPVTPTPTVTPPATPPVTPAVTPAKPPPSGAGGLSGSGPGLPLWAMALASWAGLTIVAGLGTLLAAKRG